LNLAESMKTARSLPLLLLTACASSPRPDGPTGEPPGPVTSNPLESSRHDVHVMLGWQGAALAHASGDPERTVWCPPIPTLLPFNQVVPSWNVELPDESGFRVELRVWSHAEDALSAWYDLGIWGIAPEGPRAAVRDELGAVDVDVFRSERTFDAVELRFHLRPAPDGSTPKVRSVMVCVSNTQGDPELAQRFAGTPDDLPAELWQRRLDVPFRSQRTENPAIAGRICSPTSVAMVMAYYGVERPTGYMAVKTYDPEHGIYGGWARAVQAAFEEGVPGCVTRFSSLDEVRRHIAEGRPVIASIRADKGELAGAPYESTGGHLIVITGFDERGDVHVNDPATSDPAKGVTTYAREDMERVWLGRGGVAYILSRPGS